MCVRPARRPLDRADEQHQQHDRQQRRAHAGRRRAASENRRSSQRVRHHSSTVRAQRVAAAGGCRALAPRTLPMTWSAPTRPSTVRIGHSAPTRRRLHGVERSSSARSSAAPSTRLARACGRRRRCRTPASAPPSCVSAARARRAQRRPVERASRWPPGWWTPRARRGRIPAGRCAPRPAPRATPRRAATCCCAMGRPSAEAPAMRIAGSARRASSGDQPAGARVLAARRAAPWRSRPAATPPAPGAPTPGVRTRKRCAKRRQRQHREHGGEHQGDRTRPHAPPWRSNARDSISAKVSDEASRMSLAAARHERQDAHRQRRQHVALVAAGAVGAGALQVVGDGQRRQVDVLAEDSRR